MSKLLILKTTPYTVRNGIIYISEKDIQFDLNYDVVSPHTGVTKKFSFECSTGSEYDPNTEWIYKSDDGYKLHICNDAQMCKEAELKSILEQMFT